MNETLSKRERLARAVAGEPVDRLPVSLWRHFYVEETAAEPLAARLLEWHRCFDFDFLKINARAQYHTEGWGNRYEYSGQEHVKPQLASSAAREPADLAALRALDPWSWPLGEMLEVIRLLRRAAGPDEVLLMTVFNPLSVLLDLVGGPDRLGAAMRSDARAVHRGLRTVADTFRDFATLCLQEGADGLFFATTHTATAANFSIEQYEEFGRPYDLEVLEAAEVAFLNLLHVCGPRAFVRELADYPVQAIHWDWREATNPPPALLRWIAGAKALAGGLSAGAFAQPGGGAQLLNELAAARQMMAGTPFIVSSGCTIPTETLQENVDAVCCAARGL
jgi:uroporphyrinogen decarboxylase